MQDSQNIYRRVIVSGSLGAFTGVRFAFNININTTGLAGTAATLAFDFVEGDGKVNNTRYKSAILERMLALFPLPVLSQAMCPVDWIQR